MKLYSRIVIGLIIFIMATSSHADPLAESYVQAYLTSIQSNPKLLHQFLKDMPKGADLHNHMSGATYAENIFRYAKNDNFCINRQTYSLLETSHCSTENHLNIAITNHRFYRRLVDAWSMQDFKSGKESAHNHFFATFSKFKAVTEKHGGEILAEIAQHAASQHLLYLELMATLDHNDSGKLGKSMTWDANFSQLRAKLQDAHIDDLVKITSKELDDIINKKNQLLHCGTAEADAGCQVHINFLYQVLREQSPQAVFAQFLLGFEAANQDPRIVGINLVQAEDGPLSMKNYELQMQMVRYLHEQFPKVHISLHAGELTPALVSSQGLRFHIHDAVLVAGAERIGHGVDIRHEKDYPTLLDYMSNKPVAVETCLSSNATILNTSGPSHSILVYLQHDVPVTLATDDEGITRHSLSTEYEKAVENYHFTYAQIKNINRNGLTYSFLPGSGLWQDKHYQKLAPACEKDSPGSAQPSTACQAFLKTNEKAGLQWELEKELISFENRYKP